MPAGRYVRLVRKIFVRCGLVISSLLFVIVPGLYVLEYWCNGSLTIRSRDARWVYTQRFYWEPIGIGWARGKAEGPLAADAERFRAFEWHYSTANAGPLHLLTFNRGGFLNSRNIYATWTYSDGAYADASGRILVFPEHGRVVYVAWLPALLLVSLIPGAFAVRLLMRVHRRRSLSEGLCVACGYDLRASVDRCPECGQLITLIGRR